MGSEEVFNKGHATRKFSTREVDDESTKKVIKKAQQSPSLFNSQPWRAYAITGGALLKLKRENKVHITRKAPVSEDSSTMLLVDWSTFPSQNMPNMGAFVTYFLHNKTELFENANNNMSYTSAIIFLTIPKKSPAWSVFDLGIFTQSITPLATDRGLDTMPAHLLVAYPDLTRKYTNILDDEEVGMAIAIGYADKTAEVNSPTYIPGRVSFDKIFKLTK